MREPINYTNTLRLFHLKKIAQTCFRLHLFTSPIYLLSSLIFPKSEFLAVSYGILGIIISLTPVFYSLYKRQIILLFSCITAFNLAPIWFLFKDTVLPGTDTFIYSPSVLKMEAFAWISLFQFFVNIFYVIFWKKGTKYSMNFFPFLTEIKLSANFYVGLSIFTFFFPLLSFYIFYGSLDTLWLALSAGRSGGGSGGGLLIQDSVGGSNSLMIPINLFWELTPLFGTISFISSKKKNEFFPFLSLLLGLLVIFVFFLGGSRGTMMFVAAPVLFFLFYLNWHKGLKFWVLATILLFSSVGIMEMQVRFRGNLLNVIANPSKAANDIGLSSAFTLDPTQAQQENNMYLFCLMIKGIPDRYPFEGFDDFFAILVNPIPRAIWPGKPLLVGAKDLYYQPKFILDGPLFMGTTSLSYTIVGEAYLARGLLGIIVYSIIYALYLIFFDGIIYFTDQKQVLLIGVLGICVFLAFWGYRSFFALVTFFYPLILFILLFRLIRQFKKT